MKVQRIANTLHSLSLRRHAKPLVVCTIALFLVSMATAFTNNTTAQAATTISPLHSSGHTILDASNNPVYLRGIGRAGDMDSLTGMWGGPGENVFNYAQKFQTDTATITAKMDETFASYRSYWHVNMIRMFIPVDWWWVDNVNPAQQYGQGPDHAFSYRSYVQLVLTEAAKYGIYVDISPYTVLNYYSGNGVADGIPGSLGTASLNFIHTINSNEMTAWKMWWTSVANTLGKYPNAILEMWNEPDDGSNNAASSAAAGFFNYMVQSYQAIRATGSQNLIFMQWHMGLVPTWNDLSWVPQLYNQLKNSIGATPTNIAFTTHPYRHAPYPNLQWATTYSGVRAQLTDPNMIPITRSNGIDVPVVFNEMGVCMNAGYGSTDPINNEYGFWSALLQVSYELGVGVVPYYWMQTGVWGYDESLVQGAWAAGAASPTPTQAGQAFIDAYVAPSIPAAPISSPTPVPTASPTPSPSPVPSPTKAPTPNPTPTEMPTTPVLPKPPVIDKPAPALVSPAPTPTKSSAPGQPTESTGLQSTSPASMQYHDYIFHHYNHWYIIYWPRFVWFH